MSKWYTFFCIITVSAILQAQQAEVSVGQELSTPNAKSVSSNKTHKLEVRGHNSQMRMAIASIANTMAFELSQLLGDPREYQGRRSIYVEMYEKGSSKGSLLVRPQVTVFDDSDLVIELLVDTRKQVNRSLLAHGIIEVLLCRRGLEKVKTIDAEQETHVPAWISHGLIEAIAWKKGGANRKVYEHLLANPDLFSLPRVFEVTGREVRQLDDTNRNLYKAASCAMVMALLRQEDAEQGMGAFLNESVLFEGEIEVLIRKHFSDFSDGANAIQKIWSLQIAEMAAPKLTESLTISETDQKLTEALFFNIPDASGKGQLYPFNQYAQLQSLDNADKVQATDSLRRDVMQLSNRCHPVFRPILYEYVKLSSEIAEGDFENVQKRLSVLEGERQKMVLADKRGRDYLDWFQITRAHSVRGDFSGYMQLREILAMEREAAKDDSIDPYLDRVQKLMGSE